MFTAGIRGSKVLKFLNDVKIEFLIDIYLIYLKPKVTLQLIFKCSTDSLAADQQYLKV